MQLPWGLEMQQKADAFETINAVSKLLSSHCIGHICKLSAVNNDLRAGNVHHND